MIILSILIVTVIVVLAMTMIAHYVEFLVEDLTLQKEVKDLYKGDADLKEKHVSYMEQLEINRKRKRLSAFDDRSQFIWNLYPLIYHPDGKNLSVGEVELMPFDSATEQDIGHQVTMTRDGYDPVWRHIGSGYYKCTYRVAKKMM